VAGKRKKAAEFGFFLPPFIRLRSSRPAPAQFINTSIAAIFSGSIP
jgi:hypothetical protein